MMLASDQAAGRGGDNHIALDQVQNVLTPCHLRRVIEITSAGLMSNFGIEHPNCNRGA